MKQHFSHLFGKPYPIIDQKMSFRADILCLAACYCILINNMYSCQTINLKFILQKGIQHIRKIYLFI